METFVIRLTLNDKVIRITSDRGEVGPQGGAFCFGRAYDSKTWKIADVLDGKGEGNQVNDSRALREEDRPP